MHYIRHMRRLTLVLFLFGTLCRSEVALRPEVDREELQQAAERFIREQPEVVPDLRPTAPAIAEQLGNRSTRESRYCQRCKRDSNGRIQRSPIARADFRRQNPCPATGLTRGACPGYVIDHVVALKRGGADAPENMQWQTIEEAKAKDRWE